MEWLQRRGKPWARKSRSKVAVTRTFKGLVALFQSHQALSIGADDIPLCLIPTNQLSALAREISKLYGGTPTASVTSWIGSLRSPLLVIWITGFKPAGEDSRPDRGLVPLGRMLFGGEANVLSIVYGPGKPKMFNLLRNSPQELARKNGLWQAIINLSDAILVDSTKAEPNPVGIVLQRSTRTVYESQLPSATLVPNPFSENDVDTALHVMFCHGKDSDVWEGMCNPPGGDWSGFSAFNQLRYEEYRWTSLPRVSKVDAKRPDHVIQLFNQGMPSAFLAIESKDMVSRLEPGIGNRLRRHVERLLEVPPTIYRPKGANWILNSDGSAAQTGPFIAVSAAAFCLVSSQDLDAALSKGGVDIALGLEFIGPEERTILHVKSVPRTALLLGKLQELAEPCLGQLEIKVY